jgi:hypothetical protein
MSTSNGMKRVICKWLQYCTKIDSGVLNSLGGHTFSVAEVQELDSVIGNLDTSEIPEYAPLLLGWATFLCLVSFLPAHDGQAPFQVCNHYLISTVKISVDAIVKL